jgi:hypothetical protein
MRKLSLRRGLALLVLALLVANATAVSAGENAPPDPPGAVIRPPSGVTGSADAPSWLKVCLLWLEARFSIPPG